MLWKSETVLFDGDEYFEALFADWDRAAVSIDFETYIFDNDEIGREVEAQLVRASLRGVRVRLLVDGIGASGWWQTRGVLLHRDGIEVRVYHPLLTTQLWRRLMIDFNLVRPERKPKRSLVLRRLNRRNHRKVSVVDGRVGFVGSVNVTRGHLKRFVGALFWRDTSTRLEGPGVTALTTAFDHAWQRSQLVTAPGKLKIRFSLKRRSAQIDPPVSLNYTRKIRRTSRIRFVQSLEKASQRIWISNAYLAPPSNIVRALRRAAKRGVDVRVLVPERSDVWFMLFIARAYYRTLLKSGVRIFEFGPRFLHAKCLIIDNEAVIGSTNLNRRSFLHDLEVDVKLDHGDSIQKLSEKYLSDLNSSKEVLNRGTIVGSRLGRLLNYLIRYWV